MNTTEWIQIGELDPGHAHGAEQHEIEYILPLYFQQGTMAYQQPQKQESRRDCQAKLNQLIGRDAAVEQKLGRRSGQPPHDRGRHHIKIAPSIVFDRFI